jgi:GTP:adenosylcobinamide-phosphate guanylyltransferase
MDVVILAGGPTPESLTAALGESTPHERALIKIGGRATIAYLLDSLRHVEGLEQIAVIGRESTLATVRAMAPSAICVAAKETLVDNVLAGAGALQSEHILLCTCDIPLTTSETWREFLQRVEQNSLEAAYPIVRREVVEQQFPEGKRTYATFTDGTFTGGNAFVLPRARLENLRAVIDAAYSARKNPMAIARILGIRFVVKALLKKLSVHDLERKMSQVLGCRAGAVEMSDASIAFDIDKAADFEVAQKVLAATAKPERTRMQ